jgi:hypothetical protein
MWLALAGHATTVTDSWLEIAMRGNRFKLALIAVLAWSALGVMAGPVDAGAPEPTYFLGDVNCNARINSIDAALVLQREAGLIDALPCSENADLNHDGVANSVDAQLILQYNARLTRSPVRFSLKVDRPEGLCDDPEKPTKCDVPAATEFGLSVFLNRPPSEGYVAFQTLLFYGRLRYNPATFADEEIVWPNSALPLRARLGGGPPTGTEGGVQHASLTAAVPPYRVSTYRGSLVEISISCSVQPQAFTVAILSVWPPYVTNASKLRLPGPDGTAGPSVPAKTVGQRALDVDLSGTIEPEEEQVDVAATLEINCVAPVTP